MPGYEFNTDIFIERPFFIEMSSILGGIKRKSQYNKEDIYEKCQCPVCNKNKSILFLGSPTLNQTFFFKCLRDSCSLGSISLHKLITLYGPDEMKDRWTSARYKRVEKYGWYGIKDRKYRPKNL